jgi:hypothetical protein
VSALLALTFVAVLACGMIGYEATRYTDTRRRIRGIAG